MAEARFCTNCRAELDRRAETCPACGVFAGEIFDGKRPGRRSRLRWMLCFLMIVAATAALGWFILQRRAHPTALTSPQPVRVVSDRPGGSRRAAGAVINEAEAIRVLRRHLTERGIANDCIAISSQGPRGSEYHLTAVDRCAGTRLGRFVVDGRTEAVRLRS